MGILDCNFAESIRFSWWIFAACSFVANSCFLRGSDSEVVARRATGELVGVRSIELVPEQIVVTSDYPATFSVLAAFSDGTRCDIRDQASLDIRVSDPEIVECDSDGYLVAQRTGEGTLSVTWLGHTAMARIVVESVQPAAVRFDREISAILSKHGCNLGTCHGNLHGKGGFRLSLRGDEPFWDAQSIVLDRGGRRIDWLQPEQSLLLRKPSGSLAHVGGIRFDRKSTAYDWLCRWIAEGAQIDSVDTSAEDNTSTASEPTLRAYPDLAVVPTTVREQQLTVVATWPNGEQRDVTRWARVEPNVTRGVHISDTGKIRVDDPTDLSLAISYLGSRTSSRLIFRSSDFNPVESSKDPSGSRIDALISAQLRQACIQPAPRADAWRMFRRLYLVVLGRLPTPEEIRSFQHDETPDRWHTWVDRVLADPASSRLWALRWSDVLRNEQKVMSERGTKNFSRWLTEAFATDIPLTELVGSLIQSTGSTYEHPPASFHRTHRDPTIAAESVGQVFLGVRLQCARCHNHPFDVWKQDDYYGLAAYFTTIEREQIDNKRPDDLDKHVITGDEIIRLAGRAAQIAHPGRSLSVGPRPPQANERYRPPLDDANPLEMLAAWLTDGNRQFARNMANRIWYHLMGKGIVDPPDDFRVSNPPTHPELLEYLTDELIRSNYSTLHLSRLILLSDCFAREPVSQIPEHDELPKAAWFAGYPLRRMQAELLFDALCDATGTLGPLENPKNPEDPFRRAVETTTIPPATTFVRAFGKPERLLVCECERSDQMSVLQPLLMLNSEEVRRRVAGRNNRIRQLLRMESTSASMIEELYLATISRRPTDEEHMELCNYVEAASDRQSALEDILHALINSQEFVFVH